MAYRTLDELDSIISTLNTLSNQAQRREDKRYSRDASIYDEFNSELEKTYSNERLDVLEARVNDYINKNSGQFNDLSVENFALLKDKIKFQREDNTAYQNGYQKLVDYGDNNFKIVNDFRNIQELTPDADGMVEYNGKKQNKNDLLAKQKNILQTNTKDFLNVQSNFLTSFGGQNGRLTNVSQRDKLATVLGFDDIFKFGVQSIADEYFDPQEFEAYSNSLTYKDVKYIDEFDTIRNQQQSNIRSFHEKTALETFSTVNTNLKSINAYNQFEDLFKKATGQDNYKDISMEDRKSAQAQLESLKQTAFPIQGNGKDGEVQTYADLLSADGNFMDNSSSLSVSIAQLEAENNDLANQLNKINKTYLQTAGVSGLDQLGFSFNDPFLQSIAFGTPAEITPDEVVPPEKKQTVITDNNQNLVSEKLGIQKINIEEESEQLKKWAKPEFKNLGEKINQKADEIDNFRFGDTQAYKGQAKFLKQFLGKEGDTVSYNELLSIKETMENDINTLNELYGTYQDMTEAGIKKNDSRKKEIQKQINEIVQNKYRGNLWYPGSGSPEKMLEKSDILQSFNSAMGLYSMKQKELEDLNTRIKKFEKYKQKSTSKNPIFVETNNKNQNQKS